MASATDATIVAVYDNAGDARAAVDELKSAGFGSDRIYVSSEAGAETTSAPQHTHHEGGIKGWFKSLFGSEEHEHVRGYQTAVDAGRTIVSVDVADANVDRVSDILNRYSPIDVHSEDIGSAKGVATSNVYDSGYQGSESDRLNAREELGLPVVEEDLKIGKRTVQRGGVRVYSRFSEKPVEEDVRLREEHVRVDRQPVNRPATEADFRSGRDQVIEVAEYAEEPVVAKEARVVEEVRVSKDATERTQRVSDTVRRSDVEVENLNASNLNASNTNVGNAGRDDYRSSDTGTTAAARSATTGVNDYDTDYRRHFAATYPVGDYEDYAPAYRYGSEVANDPRYRGRSYDEIEPELRQDYARRYPNSAWERMKDSIRYGWDKVTGKAHSASTSR
ncbi:MAG TPA: DUF2382 domain-containing protein [Bryobacteraceae bacterium]|jgi:uncharacterized protein (TIGR02271 family)|nr:DUF2382 domain-containing protein [Bryobacteraceae bacterium]